MTDHIVCPACGYDDLTEQPWVGASASDEICPSCGIHFGYDDAAGGDPDRRLAAYRDWRQRWVAAGMAWFSTARPRPDDWEPAAQLRRVAEG